MEEFDSSDIEWDKIPIDPRLKSAGAASIALLQANAAADRISSKRSAKQLTFGAGAVPSTQRHTSVWVNRFLAFREHTLRQDLSSPFTSEDVVRFLDAILGKHTPLRVTWI